MPFDYDPLSNTTLHWPSASFRQMELKRPASSPDANSAGPELSARRPDSNTWITSGCHENGASAPSKFGAQSRAMASSPRDGSLPLKKTASGDTKVRKASRSRSEKVFAKAISRASTSAAAASSCPWGLRTGSRPSQRGPRSPLPTYQHPDENHPSETSSARLSPTSAYTATLLLRFHIDAMACEPQSTGDQPHVIIRFFSGPQDSRQSTVQGNRVRYKTCFWPSPE
jgi:hypothetical protein